MEKTRADFPSLVAALQPEAMYAAPSDSGRSEVSRQPIGRVSRDASLAVHDLVDPPRWHPDREASLFRVMPNPSMKSSMRTSPGWIGSIRVACVAVDEFDILGPLVPGRNR